MPLQDAAAAAAQKRKSVGETRRESAKANLTNLKSPKSPALPGGGGTTPRSPFGKKPSTGGESPQEMQLSVSSLAGTQGRRSVGFNQQLNQSIGRQSPTTPSGSPGPTGSPRKRRVSMKKNERGEDGEGVVEETNNVKVFLRVRPFNQREIDIHNAHYDSFLRSIIDMPEGPDGQVHFLEKVRNDEDDEDEYHTAEIFDFDRCMWSIYPEQQPYDHEFCTQFKLYDHMGAPALANAWKGFNTCIFAYGQTGAGKTHTMMGHFAAANGELTGDPGVIPLLCRELYESISKKREEVETRNIITVTYETELCAYEIYNERVRDLFFTHTAGRRAKDELKVRKHPLDGPFVDGISKLNPKTWEECIKDIEDGNAQRTTGATAMNSESSRSHSVFQIKFTQVETSIPQERYEKPVTNRKYSVINLIDLAGSERNKKSQAAGERLIEATNINLSLTTLKRVIDALVYNSQNRHQPKQVPYRDSVLTMLLSHSLGGNSKTMMVACVSPHYDNSEETLNTLRYASQARRIVNLVRVNEDTKARQNLLLKEKLASLQEELQRQAADGYTPKQLQELEDEIRIGQDALAAQEEELKRIQAEKDEEVEKRYQQAFQHSFQMVVMRKQKEKAQREAQELEKLQKERTQNEEQIAAIKREASNLRRAHEENKVKESKLRAEIESASKAKEETLAKAYGIQWVEKQRRIAVEKDMSKKVKEMEENHRLEMEAVMETAAKEYGAISDLLTSKEEEAVILNKEVSELRDLSSRNEQEAATQEAKAKEYRDRLHKAENDYNAHVAEMEYKHKLEMESTKSRLTVENEDLRRRLDELSRRSRENEEAIRKEALEKREKLEFALKRDITRCQEESERRRRGEEESNLERLDELRAQNYEEKKKMKADHEKEIRDLHKKYTAQLQEYKEKIDDQISVLNDVTRREIKYRELAHQLESALERTPADDARAGCSADLCQFLNLARSYSAQLTSFPINRASVARAAMPVSAFVSEAPPCVGAIPTEEPWQSPHSNDSPLPPSANASRSPNRRTRRTGKRSSSASPNNRKGSMSPK
eukprot:TRINITY_DN33464_c0_g1_i1.p1 TRINITY_DN33464_c0_g1~~TRINITY_DN33464_c0_g1_i1.p1  ORF type:complete len:1052 (+),score=453.79 TRINITY_DN33464_c0_g1_i1:52-3207(+)